MKRRGHRRQSTGRRTVLIGLAIAYAALLVASTAVRIARPGGQPLPANRTVTTVQEMNEEGPIPGGTDVRIARREWGDDSADNTVILLHGSPGEADHFEQLAPHFVGDRRIIAVDLPGFGFSTARVSDYSPGAHAEYVLALMDELGIDRAHLLGFSMGSAVALEMNHRAPQRIRSLAFYGGVGIMQGEGSGDYHFEQIKYALGEFALMWGAELVPHFGLARPREERFAFIRNFRQSDFRPYRAWLEELETPLLIMHGRQDFLVHDWVAEEHHDIVEHSELVMFPHSHFMLFEPEKSAKLAEVYDDFLTRVVTPGFVPERRTDDRSEGARSAGAKLPIGNIRRGVSPWIQIVLVALATLVSEDATAAAVGLLIWAGQMDLFVGILATWIGIFLGDMGLYGVGRLLGARALEIKSVRRWLPTRSIDGLGSWLTRRGWAAIFLSRCLPGSRLPLYLVAGATRAGALQFALWTAIAGAIWTPLVILFVILGSSVLVGPLAELVGFGPVLLIVAIVVMVVLTHVAVEMVTKRGRQKLNAIGLRMIRHEFWPTWIFYLPIMPWLVWLAIRHRSTTVWTLANPGMPDGGLVGESKHDIVESVPAPWRLRSVFAEPMDGAHARAERARIQLEEIGLGWPIVAKPDAGQRGAGVRIIENTEQLAGYFEHVEGPVQLQEYHKGPCEIGVFYVREPGAERGRIFSITEKIFRTLEGDGESTLEELIWNDPRSRVQEGVFHERHTDRLQEVIPAGEQFRLVRAGNHAQGCLFQDGWHLWTPQLEEAIDQIASAMNEFHFGRFDIRYEKPEDLHDLHGIRVIEANGVTSESTNMYDPRWRVWRAWAVVMRLWWLAFKIGSANRARLGLETPGIPGLLRRVRAGMRESDVDMVSH